MNDDLSERDCLLCFSWSRTAVADYKTQRGHYEANHLPFEGFMEALCRIAAQKALPTDREVEDAHDADAGAFIDRLMDEEGTEYDEFMKERALPWLSDVPVLGFDARVQKTISVFVMAMRSHRRKMR